MQLSKNILRSTSKLSLPSGKVISQRKYTVTLNESSPGFSHFTLPVNFPCRIQKIQSCSRLPGLLAVIIFLSPLPRCSLSLNDIGGVLQIFHLGLGTQQGIVLCRVTSYGFLWWSSPIENRSIFDGEESYA